MDDALLDDPRLRTLSVRPHDLAVQDNAVLGEPWVERVIDIEDRERKRRSLVRRLTNARMSAFKPIADFDWAWPNRIDRPLIEELFSLAFVRDATNVIFVGPNGIGKMMLAKNLVHHAVLNGFTARFTMASDMLHQLAAQDSDASLVRRLRRFTSPQLLAIDEVGYLNYDNGPEFVSRAILKWLAGANIDTAHIDPGKPWHNATNESFNDKFRDECLSLEWFRSREEARVLIESWRRHDNEVRPHSSLGYLTPRQFINQSTDKSDGAVLQ